MYDHILLCKTISINLLTECTSTQTDIDECSADSNACNENADCTNSDGSYSCTCKQGFTGDGTLCEGMREYPEIAFNPKNLS